MKIKGFTSNVVRGFSLIELLVVIGILGTLVTLLLPNFIGTRQRGKDARRKLDIEQVRAAVEQYRSVNGEYPTAASVNVACNVQAGLADASSTYISDFPQDPGCDSFNYYYTAIGTPPNDYTVCAFIEATPSNTGVSASCGDENCNYCMGPYGSK